MDAVEKTARACLYEGYRLWADHRAPAGEGPRRTPGGVYPRRLARAAGEPSLMRVQLLLEAGPAVRLTVHLRFLQIVDRKVFRHGPAGPFAADRLHLSGETRLDHQEATERRWVCPPWSPRRGPRTSTVDIAAGTDREALRGDAGGAAGTLVRSWKRLSGKVRLATEPVTDRVLRVTVEFENTSPCPAPPPRPSPDAGRDALTPFAFVAAHAVLHADTGAFLSPTDPPPGLRDAAAACRNEGAWPVLVSGDPLPAGGGARRSRDVLCSPVLPHGCAGVVPEQEEQDREADEDPAGLPLPPAPGARGPQALTSVAQRRAPGLQTPDGLDAPAALPAEEAVVPHPAVRGDRLAGPARPVPAEG